MEKPKKERTEAQKKATASMLTRLKENREKGVSKPGRKKKEVKNVVEVEIESESEPETPQAPPPPPPPPVVPKKQEPNYLTKDDLHQFKNEIVSLLNPPPPPVQEKVVKKKQRVKNLPEPEEEEQLPVITQPVQQPKKQQSLTGYSLLDALLNRK